MATKRATGFVRTATLADGTEVFRAQGKKPGGGQYQRTLGKVWSKPSRAPAGYLTRAQAESAAESIRDGMPSEPDPGAAVTFGAAGREWLRYSEHDRGCRPSTVQDYAAGFRALCAEFEESTPLSSITPDAIRLYLSRLAVDDLSDRTINKRHQQLSAIFKRAGVAPNPADKVGRRPERRSGDFNVLDPEEVERLAAKAANPRTRRCSLSRPLRGCAWASFWRSDGATLIGRSTCSTSGDPTRAAWRVRRSRAWCGRFRSWIRPRARSTG